MVGVETPERKLNCRLRLMRCTQHGSALKWTREMRSCGGPSGRHATGWRESEVQQSSVSSSARSLSWRSNCAWGDQHGFFQNIKSVQLEETKKVESQCVRDEEGRLLSDKGRIRERWGRLFRSLLNFKSDMLNPDIPKRLPQHPVANALGIEPTEEEITTAMKATANAKAVEPGGLPAELLKLGLQQDWTILLKLHRLTILIWRQAKVPQQ